jgi:2-hydroxy-3-oxopropionate reductase
MTMRLGFCGLGLMGEPMVRRLLAAGHEVQVWNRSPAKMQAVVALGARACESPAQAALGTDGVFLCLLDSRAVESVVFGADGIASVAGLPWLVDHSSVPPEATRDWSRRLLALNVADWLDAPVSGGVAGAQAGTLAVMVGGAKRHLESASQAMRAYAGNITHMGGSGAGQATKLCNQTIVATTIAAIAEAVGLAHRNGIELHKLAQALQGGWADSRPLQVFVPRMVSPTADSIGALETMLKDVDTVMQVAQSSGAPMPVTGAVQQQLRAAQAAGLGAAELSALICQVWPEQRLAFEKALNSLSRN